MTEASVAKAWYTLSKSSTELMLLLVGIFVFSESLTDMVTG